MPLVVQFKHVPAPTCCAIENMSPLPFCAIPSLCVLAAFLFVLCAISCLWNVGLLACYSLRSSGGLRARFASPVGLRKYVHRMGCRWGGDIPHVNPGVVPCWPMNLLQIMSREAQLMDSNSLATFDVLAALGAFQALLIYFADLGGFQTDCRIVLL